MKTSISLTKLLFEPLRELKATTALVLLALLLLAISQSAFLLLAGPFLKALVGTTADVISADQLLPNAVFRLLPKLRELNFSRAGLNLAVPIALLFAGLLRGLASYWYQLGQAVIGLSVAKSYRHKLFAAILSLKYLNIQRKSPGQWMSFVMNDVLFLQTRFSEISSNLLKESVLIVSSLGTLAIIHWPTAVLVLFLCPILTYSLGRTGRRISHFAEKWQRELAILSAAVLDLRTRFDFVRSQHGEEIERRRFEKINHRYYQSIRQSILVRSAFAPALEFFGFAVFASLIFAFTRKYWASDLSPEIFFVFFLTLGLILRPLKNIGEQLTRFHETIGSLNQSLSIFQDAEFALNERLVEAKALESTLPDKGLEIKELVLGYDTAILKAENLTFAKGKAVAVIGPSGAGKSTFIKALCGLVPPSRWQGNISWQSLRSLSAFVSQEPFLFDGSLRENLAYGLTDVSDFEIYQALQKANIKNEVLQTEDELGTRVKSLTANFSGGQIQRLVIARALLGEKLLWLFDEATSAVDSATERDITKRMIQSCHELGGIFIAVTHRLEWLNDYDEVLFFDQGVVAARGKHSDLIEVPRYKQFCSAMESH